MKQTRVLMDMPISIDIVDDGNSAHALNTSFTYFQYVDDTFSTFKKNSEITRYNRGELTSDQLSKNLKTIFKLCDDTKKLTNGYFDIYHKGTCDPSGLVKGWAIYQVALLLKKLHYTNFYVEAGGDIQVSGKNEKRKFWSVGIRNPFEPDKIVKTISVDDKGVATSGTYLRGQHVYNPYQKNTPITDIISLTVIGPNIFEADRFATAAFAMGKRGISFIEALSGFEGYQIDINGRATYTSGFHTYAR